MTSPHPLTASPPRDTTATGDPSGCADGSESRADHASAPAGTARKQDPAPAYAASVRTDSAAPPNDADGDIDYAGAAANIAHRYASKVAENTCAAAREFAELVLEILKGRRLVFLDYISSYRNKIEAAIAEYNSYRTRVLTENSNAADNLSLESLRQNALERQRQKYANDRKAYLEALKNALDDAKREYGFHSDLGCVEQFCLVLRHGFAGVGWL